MPEFITALGDKIGAPPGLVVVLGFVVLVFVAVVLRIILGSRSADKKR